MAVLACFTWFVCACTAAALEVTDSLKKIAHSTGITVAMVIHQPRCARQSEDDKAFLRGKKRHQTASRLVADFMCFPSGAARWF